MVPDRDAPLTAPAASRAEAASDPPASATVAVARSDNRRGAVAEALALLDAEVRPLLGGTAAILARIGRGRADSTDPAALSGLLDVVLSAGSGEAVVVSGSPLACERFARLGFLRECWGRPVRFAELPRHEDRWDLVERPGLGAPVRISGTVAGATCRIALTPLAALRGREGRPASFLAVADAIHPDDRARFDGSLIPRARPELSIVEGPIGRFGREVVAVAGLDPMAVDAASAAVLGRRSAIGTPARFEVVGDAAGRLRPRPVAGDASARGLRRDDGHGERGGAA